MAIRANMPSITVITPRVLRAARVLAGLRQLDLSKKSKSALRSLRDYEGGKSSPRLETMQKWIAALEKCNVTVVENGDGVSIKLRKR